MKNVKLANRYAKALYDYSLERERIEEVYQDVLLIMGLLKVNRDLNAVMESPIIFSSKKAKIFIALFENLVTEETFGFLKLILEKRREPEILIILEEFVKFYYRYHNIKVVDFVTAQRISDEIVDKLRKILQEQTGAIIEVNAIISPEVIGGFMIKIDDFIYDATILRDINMLKREFSHNIYQAGF